MFMYVRLNFLLLKKFIMCFLLSLLITYLLEVGIIRHGHLSLHFVTRATETNLVLKKEEKKSISKCERIKKNKTKNKNK